MAERVESIYARPTLAFISHVPSSVVHQQVVAPAHGTTTNSDNFGRSRSRTPLWSSRSNQVVVRYESSCEALTFGMWPVRSLLAKVSHDRPPSVFRSADTERACTEQNQ